MGLKEAQDPRTTEELNKARAEPVQSAGHPSTEMECLKTNAKQQGKETGLNSGFES